MCGLITGALPPTQGYGEPPSRQQACALGKRLPQLSWQRPRDRLTPAGRLSVRSLGKESEPGGACSPLLSPPAQAVPEDDPADIPAVRLAQGGGVRHEVLQHPGRLCPH